MEEEENTLMRKFFVLLILALVLICAAPASAATINGSFGFAGFATSINGSDLATSTMFTPGFLMVSDPDTAGDYQPIPVLTAGSGGLIDTTNLNSFIVNFGAYGGFVANTGQILVQLPSVLAVYYVGTFTPGAGLPPTLDPSPTSVTITLTRTGNSNSYSGTLASPPDSLVPEPGTYALIGAGLVGLFAFRRKRA